MQIETTVAMAVNFIAWVDIYISIDFYVVNCAVQLMLIIVP